MGDMPKTARIRRPDRRSPYDSKKFMRLKCLDCFPEVRDMLAKGWHVSKVASVIQNQHKEYTDIQHSTLSNMLRDFYDNEIPAAEKVANQLPARFDETVRDFDEQIDVLKEYGELFNIQRSRIDMAFEVETETGQLMKTTGREIKIAADLLDRIRSIQESSGISPERLNALHQNAAMALNAEIMTGADGSFLMSPQRRNSVLEFVSALQNTDPRIIEAVVIESSEDSEEEVEGDDQV